MARPESEEEEEEEVWQLYIVEKYIVGLCAVGESGSQQVSNRLSNRDLYIEMDIPLSLQILGGLDGFGSLH